MPSTPDGQAPITKADLEAAVQELAARIERVETNLLTESHKWASPVEMRQRSHGSALRALDLEQEATTDRSAS